MWGMNSYDYDQDDYGYGYEEPEYGYEQDYGYGYEEPEYGYEQDYEQYEEPEYEQETYDVEEPEYKQESYDDSEKRGMGYGGYGGYNSGSDIDFWADGWGGPDTTPVPTGEGFGYKMNFGLGAGNHSPWNGEIYRHDAGQTMYNGRPKQVWFYHTPEGYGKNMWF